MFKRFLCLLFALIIFLCPAEALASDAPSVSARSAVLMCADNGKVIFEKNSREKLPMASTTKIMTCLVALERGNLSDTVEIAPEAVGVEGSSLYLAKGDTSPLSDLLYGLMLRSANDAAAAIAFHIAGGIEEFACIMNEKAAELGLSDTHFTNPHGLQNEEHYTTAYDFALLASYAMQNETFAKIVSTSDHTVSLNGGDLKKPIVNHNRLLRTYEGACGVKTGFTKTSGRCLVSAAKRDGVTLIAVTLNAPSDWADHRAMLDYGFSKYVKTDVFEKGFSREFPLAGAGTVTATSSEGFSVVAEKGAEIKVHVEGPHLIFAPVKKGDVLGYAVVTVSGTERGRVPLIAEYDVIIEEEKSFSERIIEKFIK